jgi:hypothetical protein
MYIYLHDFTNYLPKKTLADTEHFPTSLKSSSIFPKTTTPIQTFFVQRQSKIQI